MQAGVHSATVFRIKSKFLRTGSVKNRRKPGRPRSTTAVQNRFLRLPALRRRFKSSVKLRLATGAVIHLRTVRNRLNSASIKPRRPCLRNKLTPHHKRERLAWCRHRRRWRRNHWGNILWSDESRFNVDFYDRRKRVWRRVGERYVPVTIAEYDRIMRRQRFGFGGCELQPQN